jgi:transcription-repair coupling factor (superfamily II helicase)
MPAKGKPIIAPHDGEYLANALRRGGVFCAQWTPLPAAAAVAWEVYRQAGHGLVVVTDGPLSLERMAVDLASLAPRWGLNNPILEFPALESFSGHGAPPHPHLIGERLDTLRAWREPATAAAPLMVTSIQAILQKTVSPDWINAESIALAVGREHDPTGLLAWLEESGYLFEAEVLSPAQASWRGGILDVWPPHHDWPIRVEFFGNTIESLRLFDPAQQRSRETLTEATLLPAREADGHRPPSTALTAHIPPGAAWLWLDRESLAAHAGLYEHSAREAAASELIVPLADVRAELAARAATFQLAFSLSPNPEDEAWTFDFASLPGVSVAAGPAIALDRQEDQRKKFVAELIHQAASGWSVHLYFSNEGGQARFMEVYGEAIQPSHAIRFHDGTLSESYRCPGLREIVVSDADLYGLRRETTGRRDRTRRARARETGERIHAWTDIQPGDYVVHIEHGIGIYRGLFEIETNGAMREVCTIEYADGAKLYVPVAQTHLLSRYIGVGKTKPPLHAIGGKRWLREKVAAERAVEDLAAMLLETQAARDAQPGHAFSPDTAWQHEFESAFPYQETPDQHQAIREVKTDMENPRPMDRLICGDVGYGKTEVAMRAAFKAVMDGKQVGILVPTTVLAQQHFDTFTERMGAFPIRIEALSRFQTRGEQDDILARLAEGKVDIIIGTHRLVQNDVRFRDLGLVIIDEEQRFGVKHKEFLKRLRRLVDVLTMTATPIPRTLYMSLTGAKDLSIIETAPVERLPIETIVSEYRDDVIREAILRELNREGQVYFLHNRVGTIDTLLIKLSALVPEARIRIAHGQMNEHELSAIMRRFTRGEFDVLLCTTIIESGLNIPNVNTIIIDRADRFGLAELYQLRGRVGRYKRKAYAYLLLPKHGKLFFMARERIGAIKRYTSLGSGFKLAMRDLELRGAGNILGPEQSGHIATVGFDLYCQLLHQTVARLKGETPAPVIDVALDLDFITLAPDRADDPGSAILPVGYIEDETLRVRLYRRLAAITDRKQLQKLRDELADRFGRLPDPARRLFMVSELKLVAAGRQIKRVEVKEDKVIMTRRGDYVMNDGIFPRLPPGAPATRLKKLIAMVEALDVPR